MVRQNPYVALFEEKLLNFNYFNTFHRIPPAQLDFGAPFRAFVSHVWVFLFGGLGFRSPKLTPRPLRSSSTAPTAPRALPKSLPRFTPALPTTLPQAPKPSEDIPQRPQDHQRAPREIPRALLDISTAMAGLIQNGYAWIYASLALRYTSLRESL